MSGSCNTQFFFFFLNHGKIHTHTHTLLTAYGFLWSIYYSVFLVTRLLQVVACSKGKNPTWSILPSATVVQILVKGERGCKLTSCFNLAQKWSNSYYYRIYLYCQQQFMRTKLNYVDVFSGCSSGCLWRYPQYHWLKQDNIFSSFANPSMMYLRLSFPLSFTSTSIFLRCSAFSTSFRTALLQVHITAELRREREKKAFPFLVKDTISPIVSSD